MTPEFYARHRDDIEQFAPVASVRLRNGFRDVPALRADVQRLAGDSELPGTGSPPAPTGCPRLSAPWSGAI
ncbi:MAG: hypothetical protein LC808_04205 [Actinobacteria bacterium]|nr:hypothetical protein [Actinomycetota bacterium]